MLDLQIVDAGLLPVIAFQADDQLARGIPQLAQFVQISAVAAGDEAAVPIADRWLRRQRPSQFIDQSVMAAQACGGGRDAFWL